MSQINTIQTESIQVGLAAAPPIAGVDIWPSMDPTVPFSLQTFGLNNHFAITNQLGIHNGIGAHVISGLENLFGFKTGLGGQANAEPTHNSAAPSFGLSSINGNLAGTWKYNGLPIQTTSDIKLKTNIKPLENSLNKVLQLRGVEYDRTDYEIHQIGMIAQEVEQVMPDLVQEDSEGTKVLHYQNLTAVLVEAIKEQQEQINTLKQTVQELSTKLENCCP